MPTILSFLSGRQITNDSGVPQSGAKLFHYRATTTTPLTVWQDEGATLAHAQPVQADSGGFLPLIYIDDTFAWKTVATTAAGVTLPQYGFDNLAAAEAGSTATGFAPPLFPWVQVTSAGSPVNLAAADAGNAYEADTTGGSVTFNLPSAASVGNGKGFVFKKTAAANSLIVDPSGTETIDGASASYTMLSTNDLIGIYSNGAAWYIVDILQAPATLAAALGGVLPGLQSLQVIIASGTWTKPAGISKILAIGTGGGAGGGDSNSSNVGMGGGAAGGTSIALVDVSAIASETVTIGAGGPGSTVGGNGTAGGNTTFGAHFTANGGGANSGGQGGVGGTATGGDMNIPGGDGLSAVTGDGGNGGQGGTSFWGGGGRGGYDGDSGTGAGGNAGAYGAGGGGTHHTGTNGGNGKAGVVFVLEFGA